ncbi:hypothetical protein F7725_014943 [Dissostichus mawsoni]|uniref:Uncharacterized protein n=1 Tax=Dissostichus mawsoni TaxID=36200 RepID=A0A7J5YG38_DISMA|nr:hypothetical protein F7725_014943 [Dissostichus mawsoni]
MLFVYARRHFQKMSSFVEKERDGETADIDRRCSRSPEASQREEDVRISLMRPERRTTEVSVK